MLPVQEIFLSLADAANKNKDNWLGFQAVLDRAFGKKAIGPIVAAIGAINNGIKDQDGVLRTGRDALAQFSRPVSEMGGGLAEMTEKSLTPLEAQLNVLSEAWFNLRATLLSTVVPLLAPIAAAFSAVIGFVRGLFDAVPGAKMLFGALATGAGVLIALWSAKAIARAGAVLLMSAMEWLAKATAQTTGQVVGSTQALTGWSMAADKAAVSGAAASKSIAATGTAAAAAGAAGAAGGGGAAGNLTAAGTGLLAGAGALMKTAGRFLKIGLMIEAGLWVFGKLKQGINYAFDAEARRDEILEKMAKMEEKTQTERKRQLAMEAAEQAEIARKQKALIDTWFYASRDIQQAAFNLGKQALPGRPELSRGAASFMEKGGAKFEPEAQAKYNEQMTNLTHIFEKAEAGKLISPGEVDKAQTSLRLMGDMLLATDLPAKEVAKNYDSLRKGLDGLRYGSKELFDVWTSTGIIKPGAEVGKQRLGAEQNAAIARGVADSLTKTTSGTGELWKRSKLPSDKGSMEEFKKIRIKTWGTTTVPEETSTYQAERRGALVQGFDKLQSWLGGTSLAQTVGDMAGGEYFKDRKALPQAAVPSGRQVVAQGQPAPRSPRKPSACCLSCSETKERI
jgi:hypothetical protein